LKFNHNVHSVRVLDTIFRRNVSLQTLDGIICLAFSSAYPLANPPKSKTTFESLRRAEWSAGVHLYAGLPRNGESAATSKYPSVASLIFSHSSNAKYSSSPTSILPEAIFNFAAGLTRTCRLNTISSPFTIFSTPAAILSASFPSRWTKRSSIRVCIASKEAYATGAPLFFALYRNKAGRAASLPSAPHR